MNAVDPNLLPKTRALYESLHAATGRFSMVGHQDDTFCHHAADADSDIKAVAGAYPAVWGFDAGRIELGWSENIDRIPFADIRREMRRAYDMGAMVTVSWHSVNPITEGGYGENMAPRTVAAVLPGGNVHGKYLEWLDRLADFLTSVTTPDGEPIPIVFRPYHEHTGVWFWWSPGSSVEATDNAPDEYAALWRMTVEHLRDVRGVHNLLYAYSPDRSRIDMTDDATRRADYLYGYPGDAYVDVLGVDDYWDIGLNDERRTPEESHAALIRMLTLVGRITAERGKLAAVTEVGSPSGFASGLHAGHPWTGYLLSAMTANEWTRRLLWALPWRNSGEGDAYGTCGTPLQDSVFAADFRDFVRDGFLRTAATFPPLYGERT